ncbi:YraN family protein [Psychrobium sp. 1_MG-2023]|uniref:YraN family protein n=1 Tax=Psychrobium sp. 1_MG-2023 TaxID=3062624 RepID=UPI000C322A06|nr:YraN family protein [Psychrobium sp. 1_MG-2023]MDP2559623.1 YraN family protein [Psychrobium sp. 1_MG-2023]PKF59456.1 YraN family protein [Alteromonadales bacterium alter-6D02]
MRKQGQQYEEIAKSYLKNRGLSPICDNFNCRVGEIDLIMKDNNSLVFIEVKQRANNDFGGAISAVTPAKQRRIIKTAMVYCQSKHINFEQQACRFDVVAITGSIEPYQFQWVKNAFPN